MMQRRLKHTANLHREWSPSELALLQRQDPKAFLLAKSHAKLARPSQPPAIVMEHQRRLARPRRGPMPAWPFVAMIGLGLPALVGLGIWSVMTAPAPVQRAVAQITALSGPAPDLSLDQQALYWAYALYDFDRLRQEFQVPANSVVSHAEAEMRLASLLPRVDRRTRFLIARYRPGTGVD